MFGWYYKIVVNNALKSWHSIFSIVSQEFSLLVLLKTLFAPWRKDIAPISGSLDQIVKIIFENFVSRIVGFFVRLFTIISGLLVLFLIFCIGSPIFIFIVLLPVLFPIGTLIVFFLYELKENKNPTLATPLTNLPPTAPENKLLPYIDSRIREDYKSEKNINHFFAKICKDQRVLFILTRLGIASEQLVKSTNILGLNLSQILQEAAKNAKENRLSATDFFLAYYNLSPQLQKFFTNLRIKKDDILNVCEWENNYYLTTHQPSVLFEPNKIRTSGGIGRLWSAGYTPTLDSFSYEIEEGISVQSPLHFQAHKETISEVEMILGRDGKHNIIVVGEPGTGKRTVIMGLAQRITFGETISSLAHQRIVEFNIDALLSGSTSLGEIEARLNNALNEAVRAGNIILFVDNIERLFEQNEGKPGSLDFSAILQPYLERNDFRLVGTTTYEGYHKWVESNSNLLSSFERIEIKETNEEETLKIIEEVALFLDNKYQILIEYQALKEIISLSDKYLGDRKFPEKAVDLLDETCSFIVNQKKNKILNPEVVQELVSLKTKVPTGEVQKDEKKTLLNLESTLHQRIIGQEEAVREVAEALRRARSGLKAKGKPIGSFLFLGPTGVGKTETAKALAEVYFGNENRMIRIDMSEYQDIKSISRLTGGRIGEPGILTSKVRETPFTLILLDEIDKAHPNLLNLFLQVLDEGKLTDSLGKTVDFKNTIIIATSNAGSEWIREKIQASSGVDKKLFLDYLFKKEHFKPEFLNRFDGIVAFRPLNIQELEVVCELLIKKLEKQLSEQQIGIKLEENAKRKLAERGFDPQFGARALWRVIQERIENQIAKAILEDKLPPGSTFTVTENMI
ncbi:MAG: ATP-dependent Clp protease ATP-binding subunit [Candidatus Berkelbacteria bacterium]|nr:ATP-dependent Clp protease ATP-binding subunit [Candidatus Berkelbacteria bacterium]